ncbi:MAG: PBP1A family penicillin-binding protein [Atopobiaceae bacterium]|nr:PBP1A family penicillin-binding protein [Atopobiaceae bacterium]
MSVRNRRARKHSRTHIVGFGIAGILGFLALLVIALAVSAGALVNSWLLNLPDYQSADAYLVAEPTQVYDADNNVIAEYYLQNRRIVTKDQVSPYVLWGTVDMEDIRFYQHNGIDPQGIVRAVIAQFTGGAEGASTITQQLVRNTVLSEEQFEQTLKRKVREAYIAIQMEKKYSKDQILMMYINTIYYGHAAYGIQAAAITYFNKDAKNLTLAEAALLAGLPQSPSYYDPTENPEAAIQRRNTILDRMYSAGDITKEECEAAQAEPLTLNLGQVMDEQGTYPYFTDYVKQLLLEDFDQDTVFQGGLKVHTTLDPSTQSMAEQSVKERLEEYGNDELESALVAIDPNTGYIKAMIGGRDYNVDQFNLATMARRQPGSSFKTFTLAAALSNGMNPNIFLNCNSPIQVTPTWQVQNFGNYSYGDIMLSEALARSSNTGFVQVAEAIGADSIVEYAKKMGIDEELPNYTSITLGTVGVPPVQMAEAYATLATGGIHRDSVAITKIEDRNGNTVYEHEDKPERVLDEAIAQAETEVLEGVITDPNGTAHSMQNLITFNQPIAGKTGTSESYRDLWFCGYTPQISVAVWSGYRTESTVYLGRSIGHPDTVSCPIFATFTNKLLNGVERAEFPTTNTKPDYRENSSWEFTNTDSWVSSREDGVVGNSYSSGSNYNSDNGYSNNNGYNNNYSNYGNNNYYNGYTDYNNYNGYNNYDESNGGNTGYNNQNNNYGGGDTGDYSQNYDQGGGTGNAGNAAGTTAGGGGNAAGN